MMKTITIPLIAILCLIALVVSRDGEPPWVLKKNENGIVVYARTFEGTSQMEVKAMTNINVSYKAVVGLLMDVKSCTSWVYSCKKSTLLEQVNETECYYYNYTTLPWPASDRDAVLYINAVQDKKTGKMIVTTKAIPGTNRVKEIEGVVRITDLNITWIIIPKSDNACEVQYFVKGSPGGSLPEWIVALFIDTGPYETLLKLKAVVKNTKYINYNPDYIIDPDK